MLIDGSSLEPNQPWKTDICIVGAGAAGIAMAYKLSGRGKSVALLESGFDADGPQELYRGVLTDLMSRVDSDFLCRSRKRFYGGTTNCWGGWCRPLDDHDLEPRNGIPSSGWSIDYAELDRYFGEAEALCNLGGLLRYDDAKYWGYRANLNPLDLGSGPLQNVIFKSIESQNQWRFRNFYCQALRDSANVTVIQNANVLKVRTDADARTVNDLLVATIEDGREGRRFTVEAQRYVLALGGIETVRLLLVSQLDQHPIGNDRALGKNFMVHPLIVNAGTLTFPTPLSNVTWPFYSGSSRVYFGAAESEPALAASPSTAPSLPPEDPQQGVPQALKAAADCTIYEPPFNCRTPIPARFVNVWCALAPTVAAQDTNEIGNFRIILRTSDWGRTFSIDVNWEQAPNPKSRLDLCLDEEDPIFHCPRIQLDWRLAMKDKETVRAALELLGQQFPTATLEVDVDLSGDENQWPTRSTDPVHYLQPGDHHMGTTPMAADLSQAYTLGNAQVQGVDNLYIASSSLFPTVGYANPTLTIVALAARLADHLRGLP